MATINRPTTKTVISTTQWGIPITDQVNANTTDVAALKALGMTPTAWTNVTFQNGWSNYTTGNYITQYRKIGDLVYLRGGAFGGTMSVAMFTLPVGFRPPSNFQAVASSWAVIGYFEVNTAGMVTPLQGDNRFISVSAIFSITP